MARSALHQFVPSLLAGDAVGEHMRHLQRILRQHGVESDIFADATDAASAGRARHVSEYAGGTAALYQFAVGHDMASFVVGRAETVAVNSHNTTPPAYFSRWRQPELARSAVVAEAQLRQLAHGSSLGLAVSSFNAADLTAAGFDRVEVAPILMTDDTSTDIDLELLDRLRSTRRPGSSDWLFTGRIVANKAQHDLICAFDAFRRQVDGGARLWLIGRTDSPMYERTLRRLTVELGCGGSVELTGSIARPALLSHLYNADVYVCLSDHEGFCVPLVEAMRASLPIVAFDAGAVAETLGAAGLLISDKSAATVVAAVQTALEPTRRAELISNGLARSAELSLDRAGEHTWAILEDWLACSAD